MTCRPVELAGSAKASSHGTQKIQALPSALRAASTQTINTNAVTGITSASNAAKLRRMNG